MQALPASFPPQYPIGERGNFVFKGVFQGKKEDILAVCVDIKT